MNELTHEDLQNLITKQSLKPDFVSIYLPTIRTATSSKENSTRLKNLINKVQDQLIYNAFQSSEIENLLSPVRGILNDEIFWRKSGDGLAIFTSKDVFQLYQLPIKFEEIVSVGNRFYVRPLLPLFNSEGKFFVLAISQNRVRLLRCSHYQADEIDLTNVVPSSLAEVLNYDKRDKGSLYHAGAPGKGREGVVFDGQGFGDTAKKNILIYFQQLDRGLKKEVLRDEKSPLIFAGVDYLYPIYKKANTYANLFDKPLSGNFDTKTGLEIHSQALPLLSTLFNQTQATSVNEYLQLVGTGHTSDNIAEIALKAYQGQIESLLVTQNAIRWGSFDPDKNEIVVHEKAESDDIDLIDFAASHAIQHRGKVYVLPAGVLPASSIAAAIFHHERHHPEYGSKQNGQEAII